MPKLILVTLILIASCLASAKQVTTTGEAIIGNGITVEQADAIALNYAKQAALDSMGVFIESQVVVSNNMLVKDEICAITGSLIKSTILKREKNMVGDQFAVKLTVQCNVDEATFSQAITKYMGESTAKKQLQEMATTINELRKQLMKKAVTDESQSQMLVSLNSKQDMLGKYLSSQSLIAGEKAIQEFYKEKIKSFVYGDVITFTKEYLKDVKIDKIPEDGKYFKIAGFGSLNKIDDGHEKICEDYNNLNLKLKRELKSNFVIKIPVSIILNSKEYPRQYFINAAYSGYDGICEIFYQNGYQVFRDGFDLPKDMTIDDIVDIDMKIGEPIVTRITVLGEELFASTEKWKRNW